MKIEFSCQRREMLLFLTTNMTALTSRANQHATSTEIHNLQPVVLLRIHHKRAVGIPGVPSSDRGNWE